ncbi:MAG: SUMF1/EgtB/PvdO family nonheme iron enzyme [Candidatus Latescibacterota bacterium]
MAEAGPDQTVRLQEQVVLDGTGSTDPEGAPLRYAWSAALDNPAPVIPPPAQATFSFVATVPGVYWFYLAVRDAEGEATADSVQVSVLGPGNRPPVASAGPDLIVLPGSIIPLDASSSTDPEDGTLTYHWQAVDPPGPAAISDSTALRTTVDLTQSGAYRFRLTVSDGELSAADEVVITVRAAGNRPPMANAGPDQEVAPGAQVNLDGSASTDPEGTPLSYRWSVGRTPGLAVALSDTTAVAPSFVAAEVGEYVFGLVVWDGTHTSLQDVVTVRVAEHGYVERSEMIEVPAAAFSMGSEQGAADERPVHRVEVSTFWIDKYEVTAAQYEACVQAGACAPSGRSAGCNGARSDRADHPANCVTYEQARDLCAWADKRLPTEAEWEKAARGLDGRRFPWGNEYPSRDLLNYGNLVGSTTPVGRYPAGASFYGVHDLGGNVHEWTADYYAADYYGQSPAQDPPGPATGTLRVVRGGSWKVGVPVEALTATVRQAFLPTTSDNTLGLRCARSEAPE